MRLCLRLTPSDQVVPFDHLPVLAGTLHHWLGPNEEHGGLSLYSFSWLIGGRMVRDGLIFRNGATWHISALDSEFLRRNIEGIFNDPIIRWGMQVREVVLEGPPQIEEGQAYFLLTSPVLIKKSREDGGIRHVLWDDPESDALMTQTMHHKMKVAGVESEGFSLRFDREYPKAKTQKVNYKGIDNRCSYCPVIATGTADQLTFAWTVGLGHSTGVGFGGVK